MGGQVNSFFSQLTDQPSPCIADTSKSSSGTFSSCVLWLVIGLVIGSLTFEKKGKTQP